MRLAKKYGVLEMSILLNTQLQIGPHYPHYLFDTSDDFDVKPKLFTHLRSQLAAFPSFGEVFVFMKCPNFEPKFAE
jgi:hypothetical protein